MEPGDLATWVGSLGTVAALVAATVVALRQLRTQRHQAAEERTVTAHRDVTSGEVGAARDRLSRFMWSPAAGATDGRCVQPEWEQLVPDADGGRRPGSLARYSDDVAASPGETPLGDLYTVLWSLQRIAVAWRAGLLDRELAHHMLAPHVVWWDTFCAKIDGDRTPYRQDLADLAREFTAADATLSTWAGRDF